MDVNEIGSGQSSERSLGSLAHNQTSAHFGSSNGLISNDTSMRASNFVTHMLKFDLKLRKKQTLLNEPHSVNLPVVPTQSSMVGFQNNKRLESQR